ncbi:hypothetical protein TNCV_102141 [Trichonephila clavipes]|nr:hypothetical protein TNCV_102141 [Trichonephila clavipes]
MALVPLERSRDKGLSSIWSMIHLVSSFSLKFPAALLRGTSLLKQTGLVNGHIMGLCLTHCAYSHTGVESQEANKRIITSKLCVRSPAPHALL